MEKLKKNQHIAHPESIGDKGTIKAMALPTYRDLRHNYQYFVENFSNKFLLSRETISNFDKFCQNK